MAMLNRIRRKRFGEILIGEGLISKDQLQEALELQKNSGDFLGSILLDLGHITETDIIKTLSVQYQVPFLRPSLYDIDRRLIGKFKVEFLHANKILPIDQIGNLLLVVVTDIPGDEVLAEIQEISQSNLAIYLGSITEVDTILKDVAPITEEIEQSIRRGRKCVAPVPVPAGDVDSAEASAGDDGESSVVTNRPVVELDSSWESIFDAAEGKLNGKDEE